MAKVPEFTKPAPTKARDWLRLGGWLAVPVLIAALVLQVLLADRARLAADANWRPRMELLCRVFQCRLPPWHEPSAFHVTARELRGKDGDGLKSVIDEVRVKMDKAGNPPVYLTFDIDALDPAFAPGTGTPEVGGLTTAQAMTLLEGWHDLNWVGMDLTEVSPPYDHAQLTSNAAATLVWTWVCGCVANKRG